jgi:DNA-binding IscR family transcriptional regulator
MGFSAKAAYGLVALMDVAEGMAYLDGASSSEHQGDRNNRSFMVLTALAQKVEQAKASVLSAPTLAQLVREREELRQPTPMFSI